MLLELISDEVTFCHKSWAYIKLSTALWQNKKTKKKKNKKQNMNSHASVVRVVQA